MTDNPWIGRRGHRPHPRQQRFLLHAELTIYRCSHCREEIPFWGETIDPPKHYQLTPEGELKDLPPDAPRQW